MARPGALRRGVRGAATGRCGQCGRCGRHKVADAGAAGLGTVGGRPIAAGLGYVDQINLQIDLIYRSDPSGD